MASFSKRGTQKSTAYSTHTDLFDSIHINNTTTNQYSAAFPVNGKIKKYQSIFDPVKQDTSIPDEVSRSSQSNATIQSIHIIPYTNIMDENTANISSPNTDQSNDILSAGDPPPLHSTKSSPDTHTTDLLDILNDDSNMSCTDSISTCIGSHSQPNENNGRRNVLPRSCSNTSFNHVTSISQPITTIDNVFDTITEERCSSDGNNINSTLQRTSSYIRDMRIENLSYKSSSVQLVDLLLNKYNKQLLDLCKQSIQYCYNKQLIPYSTLQQHRVATRDQYINNNNVHLTRRRAADGYLGSSNVVLERIIQQLLLDGADLSHVDCDGNNALSLAVQYRNNEELIIMLLNHDKSHAINSIDTSQQYNDCENSDCIGTPLDIALQLSQCNNVIRLLKHGCLPTAHAYYNTDNDIRDINRIVDDETSLHNDKLTLYQFAQLHTFQQFAMHKLNSTLINAVELCDVTLTRDMCCHGADVDAYRNTNDQTLLYSHIKSKSRSVELVEILLQYGADCNILDDTHTPMCTYLLISHNTISQQILELLCQYGLDLNITVGDTNQTILQFAHSTVKRVRTLDILDQCSRGEYKKPVLLSGKKTSDTSAYTTSHRMTDNVSVKQSSKRKLNIDDEKSNNQSATNKPHLDRLQRTLLQSGIAVCVTKSKQSTQTKTKHTNTKSKNKKSNVTFKSNVNKSSILNGI